MELVTGWRHGQVSNPVQVCLDVFSARMKCPRAAAIIGAVARAVTTTAIDVSRVAKLNAIALTRLAKTIMRAGLLDRPFGCERTRRPSKSTQRTKKPPPIRTPCQKVRPQPPALDSLISNELGVIRSEPARAMTRPAVGRGAPEMKFPFVIPCPAFDFSRKSFGAR